MEIQKLPSYPERRLHLPRQTDSFPPLSIPISIGPSGTLQGSDTGAVTATASQSSQSGDTQSQSSQSASTPAPTSDSTSDSTSDDQSATDSSSASASPSATPSATATSTQSASDTSTTDSSSSSNTPTPSSSSPTPTSSPSSSTTDSASSSSPSATSGVSLTTFTSSFVSDINGTPTTIETPIVTALNTDQPRSAASSRRTAIIASSAVGGAALLILALAALFYVRRRASKQRYSFLARKPPPSRAAFLAGEDMDDPASGARYGEYAAVPREQYELPPRLFHASESGSVFQEAVWPPPSRLADPLRSASGADLARIVDDVMGPSSASRLRGGSWDANQSYDSLALQHTQDRSYDSLAMRVGPQHEHAHGRDASVSSQTGLLPGPSPPPGAGFARSPLTLANPDAAEPATPPASAKPWLDRTPSPRHAPLHLPEVGEAL